MADGSESEASILLVDDNAANLFALEALLEPLGYRLVKARSGDEALKRVLDEEFAVILMDVQMPDMDGFQTVALIKQREKSVGTPVIFVTAIAGEPQHITKGYAYGAVDYLTKPFDAEILKAKVSVLVALYLQAKRIVQQQARIQEQRHELLREQLQREAAESATRAKDQFLAMVSHELRTPLNAILGWTAMLTSGRLDEAATARAIATIRRNAELQNHLVEDLLDISRIVAGKARLELTDVDLDDVVRDAIESTRPSAAEKGVTLSSQLAGGAVVRADFQRMVQVLVNLLANSVKFTPEGGSIDVTVEKRERAVGVAVHDTGVGIAASFLARVFDPFTQATDASPRVGGLGLGLSIARHLVELHGGRIEVRSDGEGKGTTVTLTLSAG